MSKLNTIIHKGNIKRETLLRQNINTGSLWAEAAKRGAEIFWVMLKNGDRMGYQGDLFLDGIRYSKEKSKQIIERDYKLTEEDI